MMTNAPRDNAAEIGGAHDSSSRRFPPKFNMCADLVDPRLRVMPQTSRDDFLDGHMCIKIPSAAHPLVWSTSCVRTLKSAVGFEFVAKINP